MECHTVDAAQRAPLEELPPNKKRKMSTVVAADATLTPPHSTLRKVSTPANKDQSVRPLSPELSSPIRPHRARKSKSETGMITTRSSNSQTIEELIEAFSDKERLCSLQDPQKKPPFSYAMLIGLAILQSPEARLTLSQIYHWITTHFPYYKPRDAGWQNSIRHNLSLNDAFIKADKSIDGKGHFWQVKAGCENKFFKGDHSGDEIKKKLRALCATVEPVEASAFQVQTSTHQAIPSKSKPQESRESHPKAEEPVHASKSKSYDNYEDFRRKYWNPDTSDISFDSDDDADLEHKRYACNQDAELASSPHAAQRSPTPFGLGNSVDKSADQDAFVDDVNENPVAADQYDYQTQMSTNNPPHFKKSHSAIDVQRNNIYDSQDEFWRGSLGMTSSPKDFKKYTCSFNTNFELSPIPKTINSGPLLEPLCSPNRNMDGVANPASDLLKTPKIKQFGAFAENSPLPLTETPRDPASLRKWRTPNIILEDFCRSPALIRPSGTPILSIDDCMIDELTNTKVDPKQARKLGVPSTPGSLARAQKFFENIRFSSSGLFGVDVCSVLKRAVENCDSAAHSSSKEDRKLGVPFQGFNDKLSSTKDVK